MIHDDYLLICILLISSCRIKLLVMIIIELTISRTQVTLCSYLIKEREICSFSKPIKLRIISAKLKNCLFPT